MLAAIYLQKDKKMDKDIPQSQYTISELNCNG